MKQRILVVDDEEPIREGVARFLAVHGYAVSTAADAQHALQTAAESNLDLVILDIGLGDEDGLLLLRDFKAAHPNLPVMMLTGMGYQEDLWQTAREYGADAYTSKLLVVDQLLMDVHRVLRGRKAA